jgi:pyruvate/2-oxoglutarate dehydrogenase complex dihydrolipoamide acyltransferase (E2) component
MAKEVEVLLPQLGFSMEEGILVEWLVQDGDQVSRGDLLYSLETDKSVQEIEADVAGRLRIVKPPGETYPVGTVLGVIDA